MRITPGATSQQLIVTHSNSVTPWVWGLLLIALATTAWMYRGGLECERTTATCTLGARDLPGVEPRTFGLSQLHKATLAVQRTKDASNETSRVLLHVDRELLVLGIGWSAFNATNRSNVERINAFLADRQETQLRAHSAAAWLSLPLIPLGLLIILFGRSGYTTTLDRGSGRFCIRRHGLLRKRERDGDLGLVTGTLVIQSRGSRAIREQLGLLAADATFHPLATLGHANGTRIREYGRRICDFLGDPSCAIDGYDVAVSNREAMSLIGGVDRHREEADRLRTRLQASPDNVDDFRRLAICLMRLDRRQEAGDTLRAAYRHFLDDGRRVDANRVAAIINTFGI